MLKLNSVKKVVVLFTFIFGFFFFNNVSYAQLNTEIDEKILVQEDGNKIQNEEKISLELMQEEKLDTLVEGTEEDFQTSEESSNAQVESMPEDLDASVEGTEEDIQTSEESSDAPVESIPGDLDASVEGTEEDIQTSEESSNAPVESIPEDLDASVEGTEEDIQASEESSDAPVESIPEDLDASVEGTEEDIQASEETNQLLSLNTQTSQTVNMVVKTSSVNTDYQFSGSEEYFISIFEELPVYDGVNSTNILATLKENQEYKIEKVVSESWLQIKIGNEVGYVSTTYIEPSNGKGINNLDSTGVENYLTVKVNRDLLVYDNTSGRLVPYGRLLDGKTYDVYEASGNWYKVSFAGRLGSIYLPDTTPIWNANHQYFRENEDGKIIYVNPGKTIPLGSLNKYQEYKIDSLEGDTVRIKYGTGYAYLDTTNATPSLGKTIKNLEESSSVILEIGVLNRNDVLYDNTSGKLIPYAQIFKGSKVIVEAVNGNWYKVKLADRYGYLYGPYITTSKVASPISPTEKYFMSTFEELPIYDGVNSLNVLGTLKENQEYVLDKLESNLWARIKYGDRYGYVSTTFLKQTNGGTIKNLDNIGVKNYLTVKANRDLLVYDNTSGRLVPYGRILGGGTYDVYEASGNWYKVSFAGRLGSIYLPDTTPIWNANHQYFRENEDGKIIYVNPGKTIPLGSLNKYQEYKIDSLEGDTVRIKYGTGYAYLDTTNATPSLGKTIKNLEESSSVILEIGVLNRNDVLYDNTSGKLIPYAQIFKGSKVIVEAVNGNWYKVKLADRYGYLYGPYITTSKVASPISPTEKYFMSTFEELPIYDGVNSLNVLGTLKENQEYVLDKLESNLWARIKYGDRYGYVSTTFLKQTNGGTIKNLDNIGVKNYLTVKANRDLLVYDNTSGHLVPYGRILGGGTYDAYGESGNWLKVNFAGRLGFIYYHYVTVINTDDYFVSAFSLPLYDEENFAKNATYYDEEFKSLIFLNFGDRVTHIEDSDYLSKVRINNGQIGWVYSDYLVKDLNSIDWLVKNGRNLRQQPTDSATKVGYVSENSIVKVLDIKYLPNNTRTKTWAQVKLANGQVGWIWAALEASPQGYAPNRDDKGFNLIRYDTRYPQGATVSDIGIFTDLRTKANVTAQELDAFIQYQANRFSTSSAMLGMGSAILEASNLTGLNALYIMAHAGHESAWGTSKLANGKYNFFGIGAVDRCSLGTPYDCANTFNSARDGMIEGVKWINSRYQGDTRETRNNNMMKQVTLDAMVYNGYVYEYASDRAWHLKIVQHIDSFLNYKESGKLLISAPTPVIKPPGPIKKIVIDPGHGGNDPGAIGNGLEEKEMTLILAQKTAYYLNTLYTGHEVRLTRTTDTYPTLDERVNMANSWGADVFVSIHLNSASSTSASGYEDFIYSRNYSTTARLQDIMNQHVGSLFSVNRGKKTNPNLRVLNGTNMDAILTENGFISNKDDMDKMKQVSFQNAVARAHADAIAEFLGLSKK